MMRGPRLVGGIRGDLPREDSQAEGRGRWGRGPPQCQKDRKKPPLGCHQRGAGARGPRRPRATFRDSFEA